MRSAPRKGQSHAPERKGHSSRGARTLIRSRCSEFKLLARRRKRPDPSAAFSRAPTHFPEITSLGDPPRRQVVGETTAVYPVASGSESYSLGAAGTLT